LGLGIEVAGDFLGVAVAQRFLLGVGDRRPIAARHRRHDFTLDHGADIPAALIEPPRRTRSKFRIDVALPQIDGLHHVHLGVDQPEAILGHGVPSADARR
jgi:hypothetical protein